jgi:hypothetical protein
MTGAPLPFETWRDELTADLAEAEQALAGAVAELDAAEASHKAARAQHEVTRAAIEPMREPVASALAARVRALDEATHDAASVAGRARAAVLAGRERCADLREALRQIEQLLAPAAEGDASMKEPVHA